MIRLFMILGTALAVLGLSRPVGSEESKPISLNAELQPFLARYELPALAAAVVKDGEIVAAGAVGTRRIGTKIPVTLNDRFHLASDAKAMTALLAAMLIEEKKLRWDSTVAEVFPELVKEMVAGLRSVTLEQLLSHTSGLPADNKTIDDLIEKAIILKDVNLDEMRYWLVKECVKLPLANKPGAKFVYANMGYTLAGAMLERVSGKTWDELITRRIFSALNLETAGLGCQASLGRIDAPLGHKIVKGKTKAFLAGPNGDNSLIMGPAGIAHMSVLDFARWAGWNAGEGKRGPKLVRPQTRKKLHTMVVSTGTPLSGKYGLGWGELPFKWAPEPLLFHGGSNEKNLAHVWVDPKHDFAMVIMVNIGGKKAEEGVFGLAEALYAKFAKAR